MFGFIGRVFERDVPSAMTDGEREIHKGNGTMTTCRR